MNNVMVTDFIVVRYLVEFNVHDTLRSNTPIGLAKCETFPGVSASLIFLNE